ncbi:helix-turn-helix domain-containing protein [Asticcacaulis sp.]|uniref:helix-turn-helix domain-containing protein n=1 Tax=Asticcacaulis sp. TaxID=1872648 RepID=UPI003F7CB3D3
MKKFTEKVFEARPHAKDLDAATIGERLKEIRKIAGVTQDELAARLRIGQTALSKLEKRDDIHVSTLKGYIEALGATLRIDARFSDPTTIVRFVQESNYALESVDENQLVLPLIGEDHFPARRDVVFSIKPQYSEKILDGKKTVELRRRFPIDTPAGTKALIYSTSPTRAVTGIAQIDEVLKGTPSSIWKNFSTEACIAKDDFDSYFAGAENGFVIKLSHATPLSRPFELNELRERFNFEPPQSFLYATPKLRAALLNESAQAPH